MNWRHRPRHCWGDSSTEPFAISGQSLPDSMSKSPAALLGPPSTLDPGLMTEPALDARWSCTCEDPNALAL